MGTVEGLDPARLADADIVALAETDAGVMPGAHARAVAQGGYISYGHAAGLIDLLEGATEGRAAYAAGVALDAMPHHPLSERGHGWYVAWSKAAGIDEDTLRERYQALRSAARRAEREHGQATTSSATTTPKDVT